MGLERVRAGITPEGIYGSLAVAVVCLAWEGDDLAELAVEIVVYSTALWLFHIYARTVHGGWEDRSWIGLMRWARHEWPHLQAAAPALVVTLLGLAAGWDPLGISDVALAVTLANVLAWQVLLLAPGRPSRWALAATIAVDVVVLAVLLLLRLQVK